MSEQPPAAVAGHVPDVTVVVPVYNAMPYLRACLDSLVAQTIGLIRMQVVAVDDGSTDGGGGLLDEYAAAYPSVVLVEHQANSGGPAAPCNVGLGRATGRYVFFLGADDHLGPEALERMVRHADDWGSDVLCVRMTGTNGRWVNQSLFRRDAEELDFPSEDLAAILSNTKLFRREMLETHGIRYAHDLRVGSDQPFTIDAMRHARRISAAADYEYYFAVRRADDANLTYTSTWRHRLDAMTAVVEHVAPLLAEGWERDTILQRHFHNEVARLLREDLHQLGSLEEQARLVGGVNDLAGRHLTEGILARLTVPARLRFLLARGGDLDGLRRTAGLEERRLPVLALGRELYRCLPDDLPLPLERRRVTRERVGDYLADFVDDVVLRRVGDAFEVALGVCLDPASTPEAELALVDVHRDHGPSRHPSGWEPQWRTVLRPGLDGRRLLGLLDSASLPGGDGPWAVRLLLHAEDHVESLPVRVPSRRLPVRGGRPRRGSLVASVDDRSRLRLRRRGSRYRRLVDSARRVVLGTPLGPGLRRGRELLHRSAPAIAPPTPSS